MAYLAGRAFLQIVPSFQGLEKAIRSELRDIGQRMGDVAEQGLPEGFAEGMRQVVKDAEAAGRKAGKELTKGLTTELTAGGKKAGEQAGVATAGAFERSARAALARAAQGLPAFAPEANLDAFDRSLREVRRELEDLAAAPVFDEDAVLGAMARLRAELGRLQATSDTVQRASDTGFAAGILDALADAADAASRRGYDAAGAFAEAFERRLKAMLRALPQVDPEHMVGQAQEAVSGLRAQLLALSRQRVGVDISVEQAERALLRVARQLDALRKASTDQQLSYDVDAALAEVRAFYADVRTQAQRAAQERFDADLAALRRTRAAEKVEAEKAEAERKRRQIASIQESARLREKEIAEDSSARLRAARAEIAERERLMAESARRQAQEYQKTLGGALQGIAQAASVRISGFLPEGEVSRAREQLFALRQELTNLAALRPAIDIDTAEFMRRLGEVETALRAISLTNAEIEVEAEVVEAIAELMAVERLRENLDGKRAKIDTDVDTAGLLLLAASSNFALGRLGFLIAAGASIGTAIVPAAAAAVGAIGMIGTAAAAAAAGVGTLVLGFSGISDAVKAMGALEADGLRASRQAAGEQARLSQQRERAAARAAENEARYQEEVRQRAGRIKDAVDQVANAERNLDNVRANNARNARQAARTIERAEQDVVDAQREAERVQQDLTEAREDARRALQDLTDDIEENALRQRQANLDIAEAKAKLDKLISNPRATEAEREQARINYEERLLQLRGLKTEQQRLAEDKAKADRDGIEGSEQVQRAQERIRAANQRVAEAQQRVADATVAAQDQQRQAAHALAGAQASVASAQRNLLEAQAQSVRRARDLEVATTSAGTQGSAAMDKLTQAMNNLSPAGRRFALFIFGLKDEFRSLRDAAAEGLLPGVQQAITNLLPHLGSLRKFIFDVSSKMGELFVRAVAELERPTWKRFFGYLRDSAVPSLETMFQAASNVARGLAALFLAFTPLNEPMGEGLVEMTEGFAKWAESLRNSAGMKEFIDYVKANGPTVVGLIGQLGEFVFRLAVAAAPIGALVVQAFEKLFEWLNLIPTDVLMVLIGAIATLSLTMIGFSAATAIMANLLVLKVAAIVAGVTLLIGGAVVLFMRYRDELAAVWDGVVAAVGRAVEFLRPQIDAIGIFLTNLRDAVLIPLGHTFKTVAELIWKALQYAWTEFIRPIFNAIYHVIKDIVAPIVVWLYQNIFKPTMTALGIVLNVFGAVAKVAFGIVQIAIKLVAGLFVALYNVTIKPIWDKLKPIFQAIGDVWNKYVAPHWKKALDSLGKMFAKFRDAAKVPIKFVIEKVLNEGLLAGYNKIAGFFKVKPDDVQVPKPRGWATGGAVRGPGTSTSDSILARLSNDEHVWTAREVAAAGGHQAVEALRAAVLTAPRRARGGPVGEGVGDGLGDWFRKGRQWVTDAFDSVVGFVRDPIGNIKSILKKLVSLIPGRDSVFGQIVAGLPRKAVDIMSELLSPLKQKAVEGPSGPLPSGAALGYRRMTQILRQQFPGMPVYSDFRPGSITATGNLSYHALGRAVDIPPRMDIFNWIRANFPNSRELIFSPAGRKQIWNGRPHVYTEPTRSDHYDHVHWAYDNGGWLMPGVSTVINGTGRPEPVFTDGQWRLLSQTLAQATSSAGGGITHNWNFRDTTLTPERLASIERRQAAVARVGRAR